jgi:hypothetical protein
MGHGRRVIDLRSPSTSITPTHMHLQTQRCLQTASTPASCVHYFPVPLVPLSPKSHYLHTECRGARRNPPSLVLLHQSDTVQQAALSVLPSVCKLANTLLSFPLLGSPPPTLVHPPPHRIDADGIKLNAIGEAMHSLDCLPRQILPAFCHRPARTRAHLNPIAAHHQYTPPALLAFVRCADLRVEPDPFTLLHFAGWLPQTASK